MKHLVLTKRTRRCRQCGAATVWALETDLDTDRGLCLDHPNTPPERGPGLTEREAFALLVRTFGIDRVERAPQGPVNGPCAGCGASIVRYGPDANGTLCGPCAAARKDTT